MNTDNDSKTLSLSGRLVGLLSRCTDSTLPIAEVGNILGVDAHSLIHEINLETSFSHDKVLHDASKQVLTLKAEYQKKHISVIGFNSSLSLSGMNFASNASSPSFYSLAGGIGSLQEAVHAAQKHAIQHPMGDARSFGQQGSPTLGVGQKRSVYRSDANASLSNMSRRWAIRKARLGMGLSHLPNHDLQTGRVGYVCVADEFNLSELEIYYRGQGYYTKFDFDVLHVRFSDTDMQASTPYHGDIDMNYGAGGATSTSSSAEKNYSPDGGAAAGSPKGLPSPDDKGNPLLDVDTEAEKSSHRAALARAINGFDLFLFEYGAVVWWGFNHRCFKIVETDFMLPHSPIGKYMTHRYSTQLVNENYPVWCTYSLTQKESLEVDQDFKDYLRFDHFLIPYGRGDPSMCSIAMLCASHALAQSAKIDYLEIKVQEVTISCAPLPRELRETGHVTVSERRLLQLRGEVLSYRLMLRSGSDLIDEPSFFWENAYLKPVFQATKEGFDITSRVEALDNKLGANNEILSMLAEEFSQRHGARLEWIVIWLVFVEVIIGVLELCVDVRPWFRLR